MSGHTAGYAFFLDLSLTDLRNYIPRTRAYPAILPLSSLDHTYLEHELRIENAYSPP